MLKILVHYYYYFFFGGGGGSFTNIVIISSTQTENFPDYGRIIIDCTNIANRATLLQHTSDLVAEMRLQKSHSQEE